MKPKIIILAVASAICLSGSAQTLQWETDLTTMPTNTIPYNGYLINIAEFPSGETAILTWSYPNAQIFILNNTGDYLAQGIWETEEYFGQDLSVLENYSITNFLVRLNIAETHIYYQCSVSNSAVISTYMGRGPQVSGVAQYSGGLYGVNNVYDSSSTFFDYSHTNSVLRKYHMGSSQPRLAGGVISGHSGSNYMISWDSHIGEQYQIQSSSNLITWADIGNPIVGTGVRLQWVNPIDEDNHFYRVELK